MYRPVSITSAWYQIPRSSSRARLSATILPSTRSMTVPAPSPRSPRCSRAKALIWTTIDSSFYRYVSARWKELTSQGEVESIALMKAKAQNEHEDGLLEYLEDIIGTTKYKQPIEDANKEIEELNEQRGEKMNRLHVVEHELNALDKKKREAEDYLRLANELTRKRSMLWQFYMHSSRSNIEITTEKIVSSQS